MQMANRTVRFGSNGSDALVPRLTTFDGNQRWGRINRIWSTSAEAHQVGVDNFNYYSLS
jgi:hypothetical protein